MTPEVPESEIEITAVRSQGAGGQKVNKTSSAIHLRFDIRASSLPEEIKSRLLSSHDRRITDEGVVVIKAQQHRSQDLNRADAVARLQELVRAASIVRKTRRPTKPTRGSKERRLQSKARRAQIKSLRGPVDD